jgi:hypothetical protein
VLLSVTASLVMVGAWAALGVGEVVVLYFLTVATPAPGEQPFLALSVAAALVSVGLSWATVLLLRRPSSRWPDVEVAAASMWCVPFVGGIATLAGVLLGFAVGPVPLVLWVGAAAVFLPAVALTEALAAGYGRVFGHHPPVGAAHRTGVLVAVAHLAWFAAFALAV